MQRYGKIAYHARKRHKKAAFFQQMRLFVILEVANDGETRGVRGGISGESAGESTEEITSKSAKSCDGTGRAGGQTGEITSKSAKSWGGGGEDRRSVGIRAEGK